jgi:hypothetical protein
MSLLLYFSVYILPRKLAIQIRPVLLSKVGHPNTACSVTKSLPSKYGLFYYRKLAIQIRPALLPKVGHPNTVCSIIKRWPSKYGLVFYQKFAIQIRPVLLSKFGHPNTACSVIKRWPSKYDLLCYRKLAIQIRPVLLSKDGQPNTACNNVCLSDFSSDILQCNDPSLSWKALLFKHHDVNLLQTGVWQFTLKDTVSRVFQIPILAEIL